MGVHNLAEYVKYHQEKLRNEQQSQQPQQQPAQPSTSSNTSSALPKKRAWTGVLTLGSNAAFKSQVLSAEKDKLVVVDCFATWCGPCKAIAPKVVELSNSHPEVLFTKFDVDEIPELAQELGIRAMPTFLFFKNGERVDEMVGANPNKLATQVQQWM